MLRRLECVPLSLPHPSRLRSQSGQAKSSEVIEVARALRSACDERFPVARTAHDQFKVLLDDMDQPRAWVSVLLSRLKPELRSAGLALDPGIAVAPADGDTAQMLMMRSAARAISSSQVELDRSLDDALTVAG